MNDLFQDSQYGFKEKHFSQHELIILNRIQYNIDKGMFSIWKRRLIMKFW